MKLYSIYLMVGLMGPSAWSADQKLAIGKPITIDISEDAFRRSTADPSNEVALVPGDTLIRDNSI